MPAQIHTRKFKTGHTVTYPLSGEDTQYVILFTYPTLSALSSANYQVPDSYDERDAAHTIYCCIRISDNSLTFGAHWIFEENLELYCSNTSRGKKFLLDNVNSFIAWYAIWNDELKNKFMNLLKAEEI